MVLYGYLVGRFDRLHLWLLIATTSVLALSIGGALLGEVDMSICLTVLMVAPAITVVAMKCGDTAIRPRRSRTLEFDRLRVPRDPRRTSNPPALASADAQVGGLRPANGPAADKVYSLSSLINARRRAQIGGFAGENGERWTGVSLLRQQPLTKNSPTEMTPCCAPLFCAYFEAWIVDRSAAQHRPRFSLCPGFSKASDSRRLLRSSKRRGAWPYSTGLRS